MNKFLKVEISAETQEQVDKILSALLSQKLVTGGQIVGAPARFLWKGKIANMQYFCINSFTVADHRDKIVSVVKENSTEEVPMISFIQLEGNQELLNWVESTVNEAA